MLWVSLIALVSLQIKVGVSFLMFPPNATNLGLISSISVPISEYFPERRMLIDWCFVMTYNLPSSPDQFYSAPIWPGIPGTRPSRDVRNLLLLKNNTQSSLYEKYENQVLKNKRHSTDLTAGELYRGIEDFLTTYGFHETCLLRTICELSRHPFDDRHQNVVTDIVTFLLTPSLHEGFDESEQIYREAYVEAENHGFLEHDCARLYPKCHKDLLTIITKVLFANE